MAFQSIANMAPAASVAFSLLFAAPYAGGSTPLAIVVVPVAGAVVFIPVLLAGLGINFGGLGIQPLGYPATIAPWIIYGWLALGLIVLGYFLVTDRSRITQTRLLFTADTAGSAASPATERTSS